MIEKEVFNLMFFSPFITKLYYTFQDAKKLCKSGAVVRNRLVLCPPVC